MRTPEDIRRVIREHGAKYLPDRQLMQTLIPIDEATAVEIIDHFGGIHHMFAATPLELQTLGLTERQSHTLTAALALGKRSAASPTLRAEITCPADAANLLIPEIGSALQENLLVLALNRRNRVLERQHIYTGDLNSSPVRNTEIFRRAIAINASSIIIAHNHPSGDVTPSPEDIAVTTDIVNAGKMLDISVMDHVVVSSNNGPAFCSMKERRLGFS